jgi:hypothetical protein
MFLKSQAGVHWHPEPGMQTAQHNQKNITLITALTSLTTLCPSMSWFVNAACAQQSYGASTLLIGPAGIDPRVLLPGENRMLRIRRAANGQVVFKLSGQMDDEDISELEILIKWEANKRHIVLDLKDLTLVGRKAITFLERCEADNITLRNCAGYVREWITRQRRGS